MFLKHQALNWHGISQLIFRSHEKEWALIRGRRDGPLLEEPCDQTRITLHDILNPFNFMISTARGFDASSESQGAMNR